LRARWRNAKRATFSLAAATLSLAGMEGTLFRYRTSPGSLQAFMSPAEHAHARYVIYLGGLTDGLLACSYVEELAAECDRKGWAFVQPIIRSSYAGYGCSSLANDVADLADLVTYLVRTHDAAAFAVVGHSTGCQDIVQLLATAPTAVREKIRAVVLQAPVSDREAASLEDDAPGRAARLARSQHLTLALTLTLTLTQTLTLTLTLTLILNLTLTLTLTPTLNLQSA
jgi:predicted alpha/beta-fold hydrolase